MEQQDTRGLTQRELILEMRSDIKSLVDEQADTEAHVERELGKRPTRAEVLSTIGTFGVIIGLVISFAL